MANWSILKTAIADVIKANGNQEITGAVLQNTLFAIVNSVGENYTFVGVADTSTEPGSPDGHVFYIATKSGEYSNFGGITIDKEVAIIRNTADGSWEKINTGIVSVESLIEGGEIVIKVDVKPATETTLGGINASPKTNNETVEAKIGKDNKLYVPESTSAKNLADEEDLTSKVEDSKSVMKFADKAYDASSFSGQGRVYLRKNIVLGKNILAQSMINDANTRYIIQYDYDLNGETVTVPEGCTLDFQGGSISNGCISGVFSINSVTRRIFGDNTTFSSLQPSLYPEWFGAVGDGVTDDTLPIQLALNYSNITILRYKAEYKITASIKLPRNHSLNGNSAKFLTGSDFVGSSIGNYILYIETGDGKTSGFDKKMRGSFVKDLRIFGTSKETGLFIGYPDKLSITSSSNVNYSLYGYVIDNIYIDNCDIGILLTDCWDTNFNNLNINLCKTNALSIAGQVVNCTFNQCKFYGGKKVVSINAANYGSGKHRPEGCSFNGGFIGNGEIGVYEQYSLAFYFNNVIIDLNNSYAIDVLDAANMTFISCWIYGQGSNDTIKIEPIATTENNTLITIRDCYITRSSSGNNINIGYYRNGISIDGNTFSRHAIKASIKSSLSITNNVWLGGDTTSNMIIGESSTKVVMFGNRFKLSGNCISTNIGAYNTIFDDLPLASSTKNGLLSINKLNEFSKTLVEIPVTSQDKYYDVITIDASYFTTLFISIGQLVRDFLNVVIRCNNNSKTVVAEGLNYSYQYMSHFKLYYYIDSSNKIHIVYRPLAAGNHGFYCKALTIGTGTVVFSSHNDIGDDIASGSISLTNLDINRIDGTSYN